MQIFKFEVNLSLKFSVLFNIPLFSLSTSLWDNKTVILSTWLVITEEEKKHRHKNTAKQL